MKSRSIAVIAALAMSACATFPVTGPDGSIHRGYVQQPGRKITVTIDGKVFEGTAANPLAVSAAGGSTTSSAGSRVVLTASDGETLRCEYGRNAFGTPVGTCVDRGGKGYRM